MRNAIIFLASTTLFACSQIDRKVKIANIFSKPILHKIKIDSSMFFASEFVSDFFPLLAGKFKFSDTLNFQEKIFSDREIRKSYFNDILVGQTDSTQTDGLEIITDYSSNVVGKLNYKRNSELYYPIYIINQTPNRKALLGKDSYIFGLQEAIDTNGHWRPIEGRGRDFCGHGYFGLRIDPGEFVAILFPKYKGNFKTKIRVRIKNDDNIYISQPFDGFINEKQLYLEKDGYFYSKLVDSKSSAIEYLFYGAKPFGTDDKNFGSLHATYRFGR